YERDRANKLIYVLGSLQAQYNITDWLLFKATAALDYHQETNKYYENSIASPGDGGNISRYLQQVTNSQYSGVFNFQHVFNEDHEISGIAGVEYRREYSKGFSGGGQGLPNTLFTVMDALAEPTGIGGYYASYKRMSYFGDLNYVYDDRYIFSVTARYDGDSRFGEEVSYGFFPAISGAWVVSNEDFFNVDFIENLKIRADWGKTGNSQIGWYSSRSLFSVSGSYNANTGMAPTQLANPRLTWEKAATAEAGIDLALFNGRITTSVTLYR